MSTIFAEEVLRTITCEIGHTLSVVEQECSPARQHEGSKIQQATENVSGAGNPWGSTGAPEPAPGTSGVRRCFRLAADEFFTTTFHYFSRRVVASLCCLVLGSKHETYVAYE